MQAALRTLTLTSLTFVLLVLAVQAYGSTEQSAVMALVGIGVVAVVNIYYVFALKKW